MAANPETTSGAPGYALPEFMSFSGAPEGAYTDTQYLADEAGLRHDIASQYADLLSQLGYVDPTTGAFLPGSVQQNADLQESGLHQQMDQAVRGVTQNAQNSGIIFSGIRGLQQADAEQPYRAQLGQIELQTPQTLADLYRQAAGLVGTYNTENAKLLAAAAGRATTAIDKNPTPPATTTVTPPPPPPVDSGTGGNIPTSQPPVGGGSNPNRGYAMGGEIEEPTNATMGENATPGDPLSHEVVVPRRGLLPHENLVLSRLAAAAHARLAATPAPAIAARPVDTLPGEGPVGPDTTHPAYALAATGDTDAAADLWMAHHPAAMHGMGPIPDFVRQAVFNRLKQHELAAGAGVGSALSPIHVHVHPPVHPGIPNPGMQQ